VSPRRATSSASLGLTHPNGDYESATGECASDAMWTRGPSRSYECYREVGRTAIETEGSIGGSILSTTAHNTTPQNPYGIRVSSPHSRPGPGWGPGGRRFKSCLPDT
jgi:hypothetical protein